MRQNFVKKKYMINLNIALNPMHIQYAKKNNIFVNYNKNIINETVFNKKNIFKNNSTALFFDLYKFVKIVIEEIKEEVKRKLAQTNHPPIFPKMKYFDTEENIKRVEANGGKKYSPFHEFYGTLNGVPPFVSDNQNLFHNAGQNPIIADRILRRRGITHIIYDYVTGDYHLRGCCIRGAFRACASFTHMIAGWCPCLKIRRYDYIKQGAAAIGSIILDAVFSYFADSYSNYTKARTEKEVIRDFMENEAYIIHAERDYTE